MHVHVAVPEGRDRALVQNAVRPWLPHLLALSASSPFFEGEDTGFDAFRVILARRWPNAGVPPRFTDEAEYWRVARALVAAGTVRDEHTLYWSMRVHPAYPTVEVRVMDVCPRLEDAETVASLCRAVVAAAGEGALPTEASAGLSEAAEHELLRANEWSAARGGLEATLVDGAGTPRPLRASLDALMAAVAPVAAALGDEGVVERVEALVARGNGAARMRAAAADGGGLVPLVGWLTGESTLGAGIDRRRGQRQAPGGGP